MIRCVVFDFDGTLVDSNRIKHQSFLEIAKEFEDGSLMAGILGREDAGDRYWVFEQFASALSVKVDAIELADRYTQLCEKMITEAPEIVGASDALVCLGEEGKLLYINSATPIEPLAKLIRLRRMGHWFSGIYGAPKGKSENLEAIIAECGVQTSEVLMVGDNESDRAAAEQIRCHFVGIRNNENNFLKRPFHLIDNLRILPTYVSDMARTSATIWPDV